jgi:hypothetical protein
VAVRSPEIIASVAESKTLPVGYGTLLSSKTNTSIAEFYFLSYVVAEEGTPRNMYLNINDK